MGRSSLKEDRNWIGVEEPFYAVRLLAFFFLPMFALMLIGLIMSWNSIYFEGSTIQASSKWLFLFNIFAFPGIIGTLITILVYIDTITFISVDERNISLKFATGRVKRIPWSKIYDMEIGGKKETYVLIKIKKDSNRGFTLGNIDGIVRNYKKVTGRKPHRPV